ncbi:nuclear transport factor 2 family protein [Actinoplanes sp. RD1]|uniref:nuclear transport factor 2 family protein n=1 Tax=Actinoplanes sp. RD1 TaxID=3064538 RepID=UPI0027407118|nr:nuclear transport factor 2 family protein [Actinoplanes sp. RD1]
MTSLDAVTGWVTSYRAAWESNDPDDIGGLFAEDAAYFTEPWAKPWLGRDEIVKCWLQRKDDPGSTTFDWHPVIVTDEVAVVAARTVYTDLSQIFHNMWVLRLDTNGQARQFTEWWMQQPPPDAARETP